MRTLLQIVRAALATLLILPFANAGSVKTVAADTLNSLAQQAISTNSFQSAPAMEKLRAAGPAGLDALFSLFGDRIQQHQNNPATNDAEWERIRLVLDTVAEQRDDYASHLYWYTDLEKAKAAAHASSRPILTLRLLGNLNEEYSCANSRFFRTTLYPNAEVSQYLREHFILHWQSIRPVPRITIDMGDGRRIERTITGNSIHYILDADGNPIDALPGLYGPKAFLAELDRALTVEQQASQLSSTAREKLLANYHATRLAAIQQQWAGDLAKIAPRPTPAALTSPVNPTQTPDAIAAMPRALTKAVIETPMLRSGVESTFARDRDRLDALSTDAVWQKIAALHSDQARLDASSVKLIQFKQPPTAAEAARMAFSKTRVETPMLQMLRNLQQSIAEDTVRNEYQLHSRIHEWFANGTAPANLDALNSKIYAEIFLTPNSDAWLGLVPANTFTALDHGGLVQQ